MIIWFFVFFTDMDWWGMLGNFIENVSNAFRMDAPTVTKDGHEHTGEDEKSKENQQQWCEISSEPQASLRDLSEMDDFEIFMDTATEGD